MIPPSYLQQYLLLVVSDLDYEGWLGADKNLFINVKEMMAGDMGLTSLILPGEYYSALVGKVPHSSGVGLVPIQTTMDQSYMAAGDQPGWLSDIQRLMFTAAFMREGRYKNLNL